MHLAYRGNFTAVDARGACFNTECHIAASIELLGHTVDRCQESEVDWAEQVRRAEHADLLLWTQTLGLSAQWASEDATAALSKLREKGVPSAGVHLDRWAGLDREHQVFDEPFFQATDFMFTADGDSPNLWADAGVTHHWSPPAVFGPECGRGTARDEYRSDVAFVGSWRHYGHPEWWPHRKRMLHYLRRRYRNQLGLWPKRQAVRGQDLNDLYASVKVVVGDSCFADRSVNYVSDRLFETVGRGGFCVFPAIPAAMEMLPEGHGVAYYPPGDHEALGQTIDHWLAHDDEREAAIDRGIATILRGHTYEHRMVDVLAKVTA